MHNALHALPALDQGHAGPHDMFVVSPGLRIEQMHRREVAFAAAGGSNSTEASYCDGPRNEGAFCESAQNNVERNTMAASNHEIGRPRFSKQRHLSAGSGIQRGT